MTPRNVRAFTTYDDAEKDRVERDEVILLDLHGLWWSVPLELDVHTINGQILAFLAGAGIGPFENAVATFARRDHPAGDAWLEQAAGLNYCRTHDAISADGRHRSDVCDLTPVLFARRDP